MAMVKSTRSGVIRHLSSLLLTGCLLLSAPSLLSAHEEISLQLKWKHAFQFAGFYMAKEKGYYDKLELNVTLIEGGPGNNPIDHVVKDEGHYGITDTGVVLARAQGKQVKALAAIFQHSPLALATLKSSDIRSFSDLKGKRAMMQSGHMDAVILAAMKKAGINSGDFIRQDTSFNLQDLVNGKTDAFSVYISDQPHQLAETNIDHFILHPVDVGIDFYGDILITSDHETRKHASRVNAFIEASMQGWDYALNHIDETIDLIMEKYNSQNFSRGQLYFEAFKTSEMVLKEVVQLGYMSRHRWQKISDTYADMGFISSDFPVSALLYKAEPSFSEILKQYSWQITVMGLIVILLMFGLQSTILRRMVKSRTRALTESEKRFRTLVDNVPGAIYRCRPDDACSMEYISDEVKAITGYAASEFLHNQSRSYRSIIHEDDKQSVVDTIHQSLQLARSYTVEYRIIHADGTPRWVMESGQPGEVQSGDSPWIDGCIMDITQRKQSESVRKATSDILEMVASSKSLDQIFEKIIATYETRHPQMKASILLLRDGKLYNGAAPSLAPEYNAAIEGLEVGESVGSCGTAAFLKKRVIVDDIEHDPLWAKYVDVALPLNLRACWSEPIFSSKGDVLGTFGMYYDHVRKPSQDEIIDITNAAQLTAIAIERDHFIKSLGKLSQAIEQTAEVITITDNHGVIEYVNPAFTQITGFSTEDALGKTPHLFRDQSYRELAEEIRNSIEKGNTWQGKVIEMKKDGSSYPAMLTISPIRNELDEITHHVAVHEDLTKLQQMEEQFYQAQKMEAIGTLVGGIAHDFNNMLAGITGNIYLAKRLASDNPKIIEKLDHTDSLIGRAAEMIKQLLTFAKKDIVQKRTILLTPFLKETFNLHKVTIPEDVELTLDIRDNMKVSADITQLQQVLLNLMTNARDAVEGQPHPSIHIQLEKFIPDADFINTHEAAKNRAYAKLTIADNGIGIPEESQNSIFEPFFTTKPVGKGTGLGLSMVFGSVHSHEGVIDLESSPNQGSRFHIYLPLIKAEVESEPVITVTQNEASGEAILLVDDESDILEIIGEVLDSLGYNVFKAKNGIEALQVFEDHHHQIDLLLTDVVMPRMGGIELAAKVRQRNASIPVIFATGYEKSKSIDQAASMHAAITLNKPYSVELLAQTLNTMLGKTD